MYACVESDNSVFVKFKEKEERVNFLFLFRQICSYNVFHKFQAQHVIEVLESLMMLLNRFQSSIDIISVALIECNRNRRLAHLLSANEASTGVMVTPGGRMGWRENRIRR